MINAFDLETLANLSDDLFIVASLDGYFLRCNPATIRTLGYSADELRSKPFLDLVHPEDKDSTLEAMGVLQGNQSVFGYRNRYLCKDGSIIWLEWNAKTNTESREIYTIARNVTKQMEEVIHERERTRLLMMTEKLMGVGHWQVIFQPERLYWSDEVKRIHGFDPDEPEPTVEEAYSFYHPEDRETLRNLVQESIAKKTPFDINLRLIDRQGRIRYVRSSAQPIENEEGAVIGLFGIFADETKEFLANQDMQEVLFMAQSATEAKTSFLATMSHEIRTPLNGLIGMISMLANTDLDSDQREFVEMATRSGEHLLTLINDILDFSKLESDAVELEMEYFNLTQELQRTLDIVKPHLMSKGLDLVFELDHSLPKVYLGDCTRIRQVVMNLLSNAIKFTNEGGIWVRVSSDSIEKHEVGKKLNLIIEVEDSGIGIPEEYQERLFEEFVQVNQKFSMQSDSQKGSGLGLNICRRIMKLMHGSLVFQSKVGVGSTFSMQFPLEVAAEDKVENEGSALLNSINTTSLPVFDILVAEDNPVNQMLMRSMLKKMNQNVHLVANGLEAVQEASLRDFDLILMDINMPQMDGLEASEKILALKPHQKIYALTAHVIPEVRNKAQEVGICGYLTKPIRQSEIAATLMSIDKDKSKTYYLGEDLLVLDESRLYDLKDLMEDNFCLYLDAYFTNIKKNLAELREAIDRDDHQKIRSIAHEIKGSAVNNGANQCAHLAGILQDFKVPPEELENVFHHLEKSQLQVEMKMKELFGDDMAQL